MILPALLDAGLQHDEAVVAGVILLFAHDLHDAVEVAHSLDERAASELLPDTGTKPVEEVDPRQPCGEYSPAWRARLAQQERAGEGGDRKKDQRMLEVIGEEQRCRDGDEDAAERAAGGDGEIELGQLLGRRPQAHQLAVADHATREHGRRLQHELDEEISPALRQREHRRRPGEERKRNAKGDPVIETRAREDDDEGEKIEAEWDDPQERHDDRPLRDGVGRGEEEHRAERGEADPLRQRSGRNRTGRRRARARRLALDARQTEQPAGEQEHRIHDVGPRPPAGLRFAGEPALEGEGIGEQPGERAEVGAGKQRHRIEARLDPRKPARQQRRGRGERQVGHADAHSKQGQDMKRRVGGTLRLPGLRRRDRQQRQAHDTRTRCS